jgi:hypothetical protein
VLIGEKVEIVELLESESNQEPKDAKFNRVDIKAKDSQGRIILVEISRAVNSTTCSACSMVWLRPSRSILAGARL